MAVASTVQDWFTWTLSPTISAIVVTLLISILSPLLFHLYLYRKAPAANDATILLVGPSGAGKTSLLTLFSNGKVSTTHTSQEPQAALCQLPATVRSSEDKYRSENDTSARARPKFSLLDTPGHGKLRHHALSTITSPSALKGLIFVVDSAAISSAAGLTETAEYLYDILLLLQKRHTQAKTSKDPQAIPVLIAANKQDVFTSLPAGLVKARLEEELAKVRSTRSKGLLDSGVGMEDDAGSDEEANWLGQYGAKDFKFGQMEEHGVEINVVGGSVKGDGDDGARVGDWWSWVGENV